MEAVLEEKTLKIQKEHERVEIEKMINFISDKEYILTVEGTLDDFYTLEEKKVDYLNGVIIMQSPASLRHEEIFRELLTQIHLSVKENNIGRVLGSRFTIVLDKQYRFEPDIVFISNENKGIFTEYEFIGIPDLVVEILSKTTRNYDLSIKREIYKTHNVKELYFLDYIDKLSYIDYLEQDNYESITLKSNDSFKSKVIEGFILRSF